MVEDFFSQRLSQLRIQKGVSARDMSLSIGQNPGYINNIETGKSLPSMTSFFYICDYLNISPEEFFSKDNQSPIEYRELENNLKKLSPNQISYLSALIKDLLIK